MNPHLTPIVGSQPLPWPHDPYEMGENATDEKLSLRGGSWFMSRLKANWTDEERAAESLRRQNEVLASKIKREALKAKSLLGIVALLLTTTLTSAAEYYDETRAPSPTLLVGENFERVAERQTLSKRGDNSHGESAARKSYALTGSSPVSLKFLNAVAMVESSGNPRAVGDGGKATGAWQLHQAARQDARKLLGRAGTDRELAAAYLTNLAQRLERKLGHKPSYGQIYAAYNMGFVGFSRRGFDVSKTPATTQRACKRIEGMMK